MHKLYYTIELLLEYDYLLATSGLDFDPLVMQPVVFESGASDGTEMCVNISLSSDLMVECDENFTVSIFLDSSKNNLFLGQDSTTVTIEDSDSKFLSLCVKLQIKVYFLYRCYIFHPNGEHHIRDGLTIHGLHYYEL